MAWTMQVDGMEKISQMLDQLSEKAPGVAARALYDGAAIVRKAIVKEMAGIKTAPFKYAKSGEKRLPSPEEKEVLEQAGVGIAKFDKNGLEIDTSVGFNQSGYANVNFRHMSSQARTNYKGVRLKGNDSNSASLLKALKVNTKGASNQKPIGVIANSINSGTSFMKKQPFVRKGASAGAAEAVAAMEKVITDEFEKIQKDNGG